MQFDGKTIITIASIFLKQQEIKMPQQTTIELKSWFLRLIAYVIDSIIILIPTVLIYDFFIKSAITPVETYYQYGSGYYTVAGELPWWGLWLLAPIFFGVVEVVYFTIFDTAWSKTMGKYLLGLNVQTINGGRVNIGKSFLRNMSKIFWVALAIDWPLGVFTKGNNRNQKYLDRLAGTTVVSVSKPFAFSKLSAQETPPPPSPP